MVSWDDYRTRIEADFRQRPPATVAEAAARIAQLTGLERRATQVRQFFKAFGMQPRKVGQIPAKADVVAQVNALTVKALADPALKARYSDLGATPWPTSPAEIKTFRDSEEVRLLPIMKAAGIKPE